MLRRVAHRTARMLQPRIVPAVQWLKRSPPPPAGVVRIAALPERNPKALGAEVVIVKVVTEEGRRVDLVNLAGDRHDVMTNVRVSSSGELAPVGIRLQPGRSIEIPVGNGGKLFLLSHPWSGHALVETRGERHRLDLHAETTTLIEYDVGLGLPLAVDHLPLYAEPGRIRRSDLAEELAVRTEALLLQRQALGGDPLKDVLALYTPRWKGVTASTLGLFPCALPVPLTPDEHPEDLDEDVLHLFAATILALPFQTIVFSGGDAAFFRIFQICRERRPGLDLRLLWHGSYLQLGEPHEWRLLQPWLDAGQTGKLHRFGVVKPGMDAWLRSLGVPASFVQNRMPFRRDDMVASARQRDAVGIWLSGSSDYRKPVAPSLLALAGLPGLKLRAAGLGELGCRIVDELGIPYLTRSASPIPNAEVRAQMRQTAATLYVTISECMPMVPLESFAEGAPCLVGPATDLFRDDPGLGERLTVRDPTDPAAIRDRLRHVLDDQEGLRVRCWCFLEALNAAAERSLRGFLA